MKRSRVMDDVKPRHPHHDGDDDDDDDGNDPLVASPPPAVVTPDIPKSKKRGIIYISRIPPYMKPLKIRTLMSRYGTVLRVYLTPEKDEARKKRKSAGGNKARKYIDGWVEFERRSVAKLVAECLNNTTVGGKKSNYWRDDMWNIRYLKRFKWTDLSDDIATEMKVREKKLVAEVSQAKSMNQQFLERVEQSKVISKMKERNMKRAGEGVRESDMAPRVFRQRTAHENDDVERPPPSTPRPGKRRRDASR